MRQIKFRAWDGKQMQTDFNLFSEGGAFSIDGNEEVFRHENWIVMQFTGLHDRNGVEIYEMDMVKCGYGTGKIVFSGGCFMIQWIDDREAMMEFAFSKDGTYSRRHDDEFLEVIGNIYEHPHLIEKEAVK